MVKIWYNNYRKKKENKKKVEVMTMKKILMLVMMVVTMGLVGCGEMSAEEMEKMEKEIVSIAEENGYEMIIIKKNDTETIAEEENVGYSMRTEEPTATPFPTPTGVPNNNGKGEETGTMKYFTNTGALTETAVPATITAYMENGMYLVTFTLVDTGIFEDYDPYLYTTVPVRITEEEYNELLNHTLVTLSWEIGYFGYRATLIGCGIEPETVIHQTEDWIIGWDIVE